VEALWAGLVARVAQTEPVDGRTLYALELLASGGAEAGMMATRFGHYRSKEYYFRSYLPDVCARVLVLAVEELGGFSTETTPQRDHAGLPVATVRKRYSEFEAFRKQLLGRPYACKAIKALPFPPKNRMAGKNSPGRVCHQVPIFI
jgi:hypothetical protein